MTLFCKKQYGVKICHKAVFSCNISPVTSTLAVAVHLLEISSCKPANENTILQLYFMSLCDILSQTSSSPYIGLVNVQPNHRNIL